MMNLFGFTSSGPDVDIFLTDEDKRHHVDVRLDKDRKEKFPLYADGETVSGKVVLRLKDGKTIEHHGVKVEFVGRIEFENANPYEFACLVHELAVPGDLRYSTTYDFHFKNVEKPFECYRGNIVRLRYFVRVKVMKRIADIVKEKDIWVYSYRPPPEINNAIRMEVGIEQSLHIEFEYNKSRYHLKDVIVGKIYFLLVRIKIKHMELSIIKRETVGANRDAQNDQSTVTTYELMDGAPVKGETIPIRLFLSGFDLTPTFRDVNKKYSIRYYINLVLVDEERRRYYKQQEITLLRRPEDAPVVSPDGTIGLATSPPKQKQQVDLPPAEGEKMAFEQPIAISSSVHVADTLEPSEEDREDDQVLFQANDDEEEGHQAPMVKEEVSTMGPPSPAAPVQVQPEEAHFNPFRDLPDEPHPSDSVPALPSPNQPFVSPEQHPTNTFTTVPPWLEESPWASAPSATSQPTQQQQHAYEGLDRDVL